MQKILIVEDELKIARILELQLKYAGYIVEVAHDGLQALDKVDKNLFDLILMDVMMPNLDGISTAKMIKKEYPDLKIIMLTAKDDIQDVITGLDSGADDYVTKPFVIEELLARVRANIRKASTSQVSESDMIYFEDLIIDTTRYEVTRSGHPIELSKTEFDLLRHLVINKEIVLTREQILNKVWGYGYFGSPNIVDVYIKYLRDKVDRQFDKKIIHTVRGRGYVVK